MIWFWLGFFALVAVLVSQHRGTSASPRNDADRAVRWVALGLSFAGFIYLMYEHAWLGAKLVEPSDQPGTDAAVMFTTAYLLEFTLSLDNLVVISLLFHAFRVPKQHQPKLLFWALVATILCRTLMLAGGAYVVRMFDGAFYVLGGYLTYSGVKLMMPEDTDSDPPYESVAVRILRRFHPIVDADHGGKLRIVHKGRRALTALAVCLVSICLTDAAFAFDSLAVLSVSKTLFIVITSNVLATVALRSAYSLVASGIATFKFARPATATLFVLLGARILAHEHLSVPHIAVLAAVAGAIGVSAVASARATRGEVQ